MRAMPEIDAREAAIRAHLPIVRKLAKRIHRLVPSMDYEDLVGDGCVGLIRAVDGFDPNRGPSLQHYVRRLALGKMLNGIRRMDPVSERSRRELRDAERERFELASQIERVPTRVEMEQRRPGYAAARAEAYAVPPLSLDRRLPEKLEAPLDTEADPARIDARRGEHLALLALVRALPPRQARVIVLHYYAERSMRDIAQTWKITGQRVSQIHVKALRLLRKAAYAAQD
jgi:RNA polymerase sigma factor (sigma-70 family)